MSEKQVRGLGRLATTVAVALLLVLVPVQRAPAVSQIASRGFDGSGLDSVWSFVDLVRDSSVSVSGGRLEILVPGGRLMICGLELIGRLGFSRMIPMMILR